MIKLIKRIICNCDCQKKPRIELDKYGRDKKVVAETMANFRPMALPPSPPKGSSRPVSRIEIKIKDAP